MTNCSSEKTETWVLGIEGGGTRTVAILADERSRMVERLETGPANLKLLSDAQLEQHLQALANRLPPPAAIGIGLAGVRGASDRSRVLKAAERVWKAIPCVVGSDLETALAASGTAGTEAEAEVLILSGTGSCCFGRGREGRTAKIGGWGQLLGDKGSGYEIGLRALKAVVYSYDRDGAWPALGARLLRTLQLNVPDDLIDWAQRASKSEIAALTIEVFAAWAQKDKIASDILEGAGDSLAEDAVTCARHLAVPSKPVRFIFAGSVLLRQARFADVVARNVREHWPAALIHRLEKEGAWGAVQWAERQLASLSARPSGTVQRTLSEDESSTSRTPTRSESVLIPELTADLSPTERRNPRSARLDRMPLDSAIRLMMREEAGVPLILARQSKSIAKAIRLISHSLKKGGRLIYVGAGTSGRLGTLDASECPPTFRSDPDQVQAIMAGGAQALWRSVEGAEDDAGAGAEAVRFRNVGEWDVVVGIAASGRTPYVWGALGEAKRLGAKTILISFNPCLRIAAAVRPAVVVAADLGPEVLTGSTRLKAGTATKLVLNMLTTLAMVRLGKVMSNLMIDLYPSNQKLKQRAVRIVQDMTGVSEEEALGALTRVDWMVKEAVRSCEKRARVGSSRRRRLGKRRSSKSGGNRS